MRLFVEGVNGQLQVDDDRIVVSKRHFFGVKIDKTILIDSIIKVEYKEGSTWSRGYISFYTAIHGDDDFGNFEESTIVLLPGEQCEKAKQIKDYVESKLPKIERREGKGEKKLEKDTEIVMLLNGVNGQIQVYEEKVVITRKGILGFASQGLAGEKTIPIKAIQAVQYKNGTALLNGFIQFTIKGGMERQGGIFDATSDENTVMLAMGDQSEKGRAIKEFIEKKIIEGLETGTVPIQQISSADEILKFKGLLDAGIITKEEFEAKKKQLLGL